MNPISMVGGFANSAINAGGQMTQQAASAVTNVKQENQITESAAPSKAEAGARSTARRGQAACP